MFQVLPLQTNLKDAYQKGTDDEQKFIQNLSLFLCTFLKEHAMLIERKQELHEVLLEVSILTFLIDIYCKTLLCQSLQDHMLGGKTSVASIL